MLKIFLIALGVLPALAVEVRPVHPVDVPPRAIADPDAITCEVTSPESVVHKGEMLSFESQPDHAVEYGTTAEAPDGAAHKWRLQLGKPGNITAFELPVGWSTANCQVGKSIEQLIADRQVLQLFSPQ